MKRTKTALLSGYLVAGTVLTCGLSALADNDPTASVNPAGDAASSAGVTATLTSTPATPGEAPAGATSAPGELTITPGPLEEARKILLDRIKLAKTEGIGTANYFLALNAIEDSVKAGQTAEQLKPRIESLARALKDQLDKSKILKTQRPVPVQPSYSAAPPGGGGGGGGPDINKIKEALNKPGGTDGLIDKIKSKFGGNIPNIPDGLKDRIPKDILDKLGQ